ncbi:hypothetical protein C8R46DRAFT_1292198 [Mycena filopes]|nr:hypothetical protein C8R46DRAFT_1292198 [Mycena filopes]
MSTETESSFLSHARYGKDKVRVLRVVRERKWHHIVEYNVQALLEGDIETRCAQYAHIHKAFVTVEQLRWSRIPVAGAQGPEEHPHSFLRDREDKHIISVEVDASKGKDKISANVTAGISDLLVLKTTESAFTNFVRDKYTTLKELCTEWQP